MSRKSGATWGTPSISINPTCRPGPPALFTTVYAGIATMYGVLAMTRARIALYVFLLAIGLRLGYFVATSAGPLGNADSPAYQDLADSLLHHRTYQTRQPGGPPIFPADLERPPGYPIFLSLIGATTRSTRPNAAVFQCALGACLAALLALTMTLRVSAFAGLLTGILYATDWVTIVHTPLLIAETIFAFSLGAALCAFIFALRRDSAVISFSSGLLLGMAALIKPLAQVVIVAFVLAWFFHESRCPCLAKAARHGAPPSISMNPTCRLGPPACAESRVLKSRQTRAN